MKKLRQTTLRLKAIVSEVQPRWPWECSHLNRVSWIARVANDPHALDIEGLWLDHGRCSLRSILERMVDILIKTQVRQTHNLRWR